MGMTAPRTLTIRPGETQRAFVKRVLLDTGSITVQECLYGIRTESGRTRAITRLAAIIFDLRHEDDLDIAESSAGGTAVYYYRGTARAEVFRYNGPREAVDGLVEPEATSTPISPLRGSTGRTEGSGGGQGWRCIVCKSPMDATPSFLPGVAYGRCKVCRTKRTAEPVRG